MKSLDIANAFIESYPDSTDLTNLKLNKLVFYSQVEHIRRHGSPLFDDAIEAWQFGPVEPMVYREFKGYGRRPITSPSDHASLDGRSLAIVRHVADSYGRLSAFDLVNFSHRPGSAWSLVYDPSCDREITVEDIIGSEDMNGLAGLSMTVVSAMDSFVESIPNAMRMLENG